MNFVIRKEYSTSATSSGKSIPATILESVSNNSFFISLIFVASTPDKFFADCIANLMFLHELNHLRLRLERGLIFI